MMNYGQIAQAGNILTSLGNFQNFAQKRDIITVNGFQDAKDFKVCNGESIILMDANEDIIYIKRCDEIGKVNMSVYRCTDITEQYEKENTSANISKADFENLVKTISEMRAMLGRGTKNEHNA